MAEKRFYWLKLKEDYFNNPKIKKLRKIAGGDTFTIIYLKMQLLSVSNKGIIEFEGIEPTIEEELALKLDEDLDNVVVTLNYLRVQGLVESNNNEFLLLDACKNIGSESDSAERVRLFREREKQKSLHCNADVTPVLQSSISISSSISKSNNKKKVFTPPTLEEVRAYAIERHSSVDPVRFFEFFNAGGWIDSKGNKVKNWKQKFITWESHAVSVPQQPKQNFTSREYEKGKLNGLFQSIDDIDV